MKKVLAALVAVVLVLVQMAAVAELEKNEVVYVLADEFGEGQITWVHDTLINNDGLSQITDMSLLENIEAVNGAEFDQGSGGVIQWKANGADVAYTGYSEEPLPLKVSLSATLDGQTVSVQELPGKSGKLELTLRMERDEPTDVPFQAIATLKLDKQAYQNVSVRGGYLSENGASTVCTASDRVGYPEGRALEIAITADMIQYEAIGYNVIAWPEQYWIVWGDNGDIYREGIGAIAQQLQELIDTATEVYENNQQISENLSSTEEFISSHYGYLSDLAPKAEEAQDRLQQLWYLLLQDGWDFLSNQGIEIERYEWLEENEETVVEESEEAAPEESGDVAGDTQTAGMQGPQRSETLAAFHDNVMSGLDALIAQGADEQIKAQAEELKQRLEIIQSINDGGSEISENLSSLRNSAEANYNAFTNTVGAQTALGDYIYALSYEIATLYNDVYSLYYSGNEDGSLLSYSEQRYDIYSDVYGNIESNVTFIFTNEMYPLDSQQ